LHAILLNAKSEIARDGYISKKTQSRIYSAFCSWDYWFAAAVDHFRPPETNGDERFGEDIGDPLSSNAVEKPADEERAEIIAMIDGRLQTVSSLEKDLTARDKLQTDAKTRSCSLPAVEEIDTFLRYESQQDRFLYRAMSELERLQRQRKGENVPPPINVNFGRRA
jgi:hypothetical protein